VFWILICCFLCYRVLLTFYSVTLQYVAVRSLDRQSVINLSSNGIPSFVHCRVLRNGNHSSSKKLWWSVQILGVQIRSTPPVVAPLKSTGLWQLLWTVADHRSHVQMNAPTMTQIFSASRTTVIVHSTLWNATFSHQLKSVLRRALQLLQITTFEMWSSFIIALLNLHTHKFPPTFHNWLPSH